MFGTLAVDNCQFLTCCRTHHRLASLTFGYKQFPNPVNLLPPICPSLSNQHWIIGLNCRLPPYSKERQARSRVGLTRLVFVSSAAIGRLWLECYGSSRMAIFQSEQNRPPPPRTTAPARPYTAIYYSMSGC